MLFQPTEFRAGENFGPGCSWKCIESKKVESDSPTQSKAMESQNNRRQCVCVHKTNKLKMHGRNNNRLNLLSKLDAFSLIVEELRISSFSHPSPASGRRSIFKAQSDVHTAHTCSSTKCFHYSCAVFSLRVLVHRSASHFCGGSPVYHFSGVNFQKFNTGL